MNINLLFFFLATLAQIGFAPGQTTNSPVHVFRPSAYAGQSLIPPTPKTNRWLAWLLVPKLYTAPTTRLKGDERYARLLNVLNLDGLIRYGIADDTYRLTIAANRDTLLLVDYDQDVGFVIPARSITEIGEQTVQTLPEQGASGEFWAVSTGVRKTISERKSVLQITIRLRDSQPAKLVVVYQDRLFADTFTMFVAQTIGINDSLRSR